LVNLRAVDSLGAPTAAALFSDGDTITLAPKRGGRTLPPLTLNVTTTTTVANLNTFFAQATGIEVNIPTASATIGTSVLGAAQAGDPANTRRLRIEGNAGEQNALSFAGTQVGSVLALEQSSAAVGESAYTSYTVYDSLGTNLTVNMTTVLESADANGTTWRFFAYSGDDTEAATFDPTGTSGGIKVANGTISFDTNGRLLTDSPLPITIDRDNTGAGDPLAFSLDFGRMNALADTSANASKMFAKPDGKPIGTLTDFSIAANGTITGSYDNGTQETLGQVAVATFDNVEGLLDDGGNLYSSGANSGAPKITGPLELSAGALRAGTLELSNVDLSEEFVNLIISTTGFTAASRVISTSDQLLTELLNTSR
jgi:flagellar hook protein FlgE